MAEPVSFPTFPRVTRELLSMLRAPAEGMTVQQRFLEVISRNLANVETTRTPEGGPYRRRVLVAGEAGPDGSPGLHEVEDPRPGRSVYDPGHPDADANGFVTYPNVEVNDELVDLMLARRVYEANASVFQAAKAMLRRALEI